MERRHATPAKELIVKIQIRVQIQFRELKHSCVKPARLVQLVFFLRAKRLEIR